MSAGSFTFSKRERIVSRKLMEQLFDKVGHHSVAVYPLRAVYMLTEREPGGVPVQVLVSVPKRHLRHAVDRNRVKRQVREAYRLNKQLLAARIPEGRMLAVAFIWLSAELADSRRVAHSVRTLLHRMADKL